ncbi:hypothetical protein ACJ73_07663 [Blastomyces percursus]|uniref:Uncharacterized protein n=1 Tax=Blastomyces percursus TaxID=1658174 RepID=A0A1J9QXT5_9EURO|nr:hypothetical protein ACJ73_07663 [Blastomyces percursus]
MELRSANEKQSQRRKRKSTYIPHGGAVQRVRTDKGDDKDSTQITAENSGRGNDRNSIQVAVRTLYKGMMGNIHKRPIILTKVESNGTRLKISHGPRHGHTASLKLVTKTR